MVVFRGVFAHSLHRRWSQVRMGWQVCTLTGHSGGVICVSFSPDGTRVVSGSHDQLVKIWDAVTGVEVRGFVGVHCGRRHDGDGLGGGCTRAERWRWSQMRVGGQVCTLAGHSGWVIWVSFSPDGKRVISGSGGSDSGDNLIKIWDVATGAEVSSFLRVS
jgi:WD40 repeat protein